MIVDLAVGLMVVAAAPYETYVLRTDTSVWDVAVEDLTDEDKRLLEELAAVEDDFAKFMKTLHDELEKLPPQDFSDPRLLKETLETYEEVQLASDALTKKTTVLAVPLEQATATCT